MALNIEKTIDLTSYDGNSNPKIVNQLSLIHEAEEGELVQYYIDQTSKTEGDKNSHAIGILVKPEQQSAYYEYKNYDEIQWSLPKSRITRQRIDRLGVKAFPDVGAIAFYKLMYRNRCKILAPVNPKWAQDRVTAPQIRAVLGEGSRSVTFTIIDPDDENIHFSCYRINMVLDYHQLEYITYEKEVTIDSVPVDGLYSCYCIGYVNEGEICSKDSNVLELQMVGQYSTWPIVTPGAEDLYIKKLQFTNDGHLVGVLSNNETVTSDNVVPTGGSTIDIDPVLSAGTKIADFEIDGQPGALYAPTPVASKYLTGLHFEDDGTLKATMSDKSTVISDNAFKMTILKYGISTWDDFITAYTAQKIVYCRASSNSNPASGSQTRLAFMAYLNNETNPTNVEFQYYRSVATHTDSQQGDQVFVYKLDKKAGWTVIVRNAFTKIDVGAGLTKSYRNGVLTISLA